VHVTTMLLLLYLVTLQHVIAGPLPSFRSSTRQALARHSTASTSDIFASPTIMSRSLRYSGENHCCSQVINPLLTCQPFLVVVTESTLSIPTRPARNSPKPTFYGMRGAGPSFFSASESIILSKILSLHQTPYPRPR
jgi:hypothetical protein